MGGRVIVELRPAFHANNAGFLLQQRRIPRGRRADGLRKHRRVAVVRHAVQRLAPVIEGRQPQPGNARRAVLQLRDFFRQRHPADQIIRARRQRLRRITPDRRLADFRDVRGHGGIGVRHFGGTERDHRRARRVFHFQRVELRVVLARRKRNRQRPLERIILMRDHARDVTDLPRGTGGSDDVKILRQNGVAGGHTEDPLPRTG